MRTKPDLTSSNTLLASATGVGSIGAAFFGVPGAIAGVVLGFGLGYWSESQKQSNSPIHKRTIKPRPHA